MKYSNFSKGTGHIYVVFVDTVNSIKISLRFNYINGKITTVAVPYLADNFNMCFMSYYFTNKSFKEGG